jgi:hypothetical protein
MPARPFCWLAAVVSGPTHWRWSLTAPVFIGPDADLTEANTGAPVRAKRYRPAGSHCAAAGTGNHPPFRRSGWLGPIDVLQSANHFVIRDARSSVAQW